MIWFELLPHGIPLRVCPYYKISHRNWKDSKFSFHELKLKVFWSLNQHCASPFCCIWWADETNIDLACTNELFEVHCMYLPIGLHIPLGIIQYYDQLFIDLASMSHLLCMLSLSKCHGLPGPSSLLSLSTMYQSLILELFSHAWIAYYCTLSCMVIGVVHFCRYCSRWRINYPSRRSFWLRIYNRAVENYWFRQWIEYQKCINRV